MSAPLTGPNSATWQVVHQSVRGAAHWRDRRPNQDAVCTNIVSAGVPPVILAVSDGHGSSKCFRSNVGAQTAVGLAVTITAKFLAEKANSTLADIQNTAARQLPLAISQRWVTTVRKHFEDNALTVEEISQLPPEMVGPSGHASLTREQQLTAYGATLLVVAISNNYIIYLQIGDGDILVIDEPGSTARSPLPLDDSLVANETTSLCLARAPSLFRCRLQLIEPGREPALIMVSTDGYANGFQSTEDFTKAAEDFVDVVGREGLITVQDNLEAWLNMSSEEGSGDDVTLGLICRADICKEADVESPVGQSWIGRVAKRLFSPKGGRPEKQKGAQE